LDLKLLLKRGGLLAAANWPVVVIQFAAQKTFQVLVAVPVIGAAILVAVLLGGDLANLLQGSMREVFATITSALISEPFALVAFMIAFAIALIGGSMLQFLIKGGTISVMLTASQTAGAIERQPITLTNVARGSAFSIPGFVGGCSRLFSVYLHLGVLLMVAYALTGATYLAFIVYGYNAAREGVLFVEWTMLVAIATIALFLWVTIVNLVYLLLQIALAAGCRTIAESARATLRFVRDEFKELSGVFVVVFGMVVAAWIASVLAWTGVGLVAFVPLVGLAVFPLQIVAWILGGLVYEYIDLTAMGAYMALYRRHAEAEASNVTAATEGVGADSSLTPAH
jgi:hypothetical protein